VDVVRSYCQQCIGGYSGAVADHTRRQQKQAGLACMQYQDLARTSDLAVGRNNCHAWISARLLYLTAIEGPCRGWLRVRRERARFYPLQDPGTFWASWVQHHETLHRTIASHNSCLHITRATVEAPTCKGAWICTQGEQTVNEMIRKSQARLIVLAFRDSTGMPGCSVNWSLSKVY
jgi:hypothetical protein